MYELRDEATRALTPKSDHAATEATAPETWIFDLLDVSRPERVTHVAFKRGQAFGKETESNLREDLSQLADRLARCHRDLPGVIHLSTKNEDSNLRSRSA